MNLNNYPHYTDILGHTYYKLPVKLIEPINELIEAAKHFIWKCENGKARSTESYNQFKKILKILKKEM